ncbi:tyrosine-type recombinase/integrase [Nocardia sp. NPDC050710]|uniref:tyrosine-type recombinase/integrase n=1 Tax=Nocardia sp. NPDC050710 TaxID=3157220 RepID=UPI003402FDBA
MGTSTDIDVAFVGDDLVLRLAGAAYLARYTGSASPTLGLSHLQFEALLTVAQDSAHASDSRWWRRSHCWECGSSKPADPTSTISAKNTGIESCELSARAPRSFWCRYRQQWAGHSTNRAVTASSPILLNTRSRRMDRHCATRRLRKLAQNIGMRLPQMHPHMLRHTFVTTMLDAGVGLRDVQIAALMPTRARPCATTGRERISTGTRTTFWPPTWPPAHDISTVHYLAEFRVSAGAWTLGGTDEFCVDPSSIPLGTPTAVGLCWGRSSVGRNTWRQ